MTELHIESRPAFPWVGVFSLALALVCAAAAFWLGNRHVLMVALMPLTLGVILVITRERVFRAEITATGIEIVRPQLSLPFAEIDGLLMSGKLGRARASFAVIRDQRRIRVPARLNVDSDELFRFLLEKLPTTHCTDLPSVLERYCGKQKVLHGADRVIAHRARNCRLRKSHPREVAVCTACLVVGCIWAVLGGMDLRAGGGAWIAIGSLTAFVMFLVIVGYTIESSAARIRNWRQAGLVIGPGGLALSQGNMTGELRWEELRDIRYPSRRAFLDAQATEGHFQGIQLKVGGASIIIADIYNRPLGLIYEQLMQGWNKARDEE
jgi:hypothetical protein